MQSLTMNITNVCCYLTSLSLIPVALPVSKEIQAWGQDRDLDT